ncbi:hypothetical protein V2J09_004339 [Rumex salicifolius]
MYDVPLCVDSLKLVAGMILLSITKPYQHPRLKTRTRV